MIHSKKRNISPPVICECTPTSKFGKAFGESFVSPVLTASLGIKDRP